jgi:hypothetical protein
VQSIVSTANSLANSTRLRVILSAMDDTSKRWRGRLFARRNLLPVGIVAFWLAMMFSLVRNEILPIRRAMPDDASAFSPRQIARKWRDYSEYMLVTYGGVEVGAASTSITRELEEPARYTVDTRFDVSLGMLAAARHVSLIARAELDDNFELSRFHIRCDLVATKIAVTGMVSEEVLYVETEQGGRIKRTRFALDRAISLLDAVRPIAARNLDVVPGRTVRVPVVDPVWSMDVGTLEVRIGDIEKITVGGAGVDAYRVESRLNDFVSTAWVDATGRTLRRQLAGQLALERTTPARAFQAGTALVDTLTMPDINPADFANIRTEPLSRFASSGASPFSILGSLGER